MSTDTKSKVPEGVGSTLLTIRNATKKFPGVLALDHVNLDLNHGEVLALVGENGAGKSTLMKLLSGIYRPDEGSFEMNGEDFKPENPKHAQELGISIIHQEFNLMPDLTIAENIFLGREFQNKGILAKQRQNRDAQELLDRLSLPLRARDKVETLSVAQQQMVEIAKALSFDSKILIMDEPTAALNEAEVDTLFDMIRGFVSSETGVVFISHRMQEIPQIADRIAVLRDGANAGELDTATCTEQDVISRMVGREIDTSVVQVARKPGDTVLEVQGLSNTFLKDISFEARAGEILGFAGLMGAGRTEIARAIIGADPVKSGTIKLHGKVIRPSSVAQSASMGIGYLSEDRKQLGILTQRNVRENIALPSLSDFVRGVVVSKKKIEAAAQKYIEQLRIKTPSSTQEVGNLSGGNQQKVAIAKWLLKDCDVLFFDEPTRGIDVGAKEEIYALLDNLASQGKTIIVISSDLPEVLRVSDRIAVMNDGHLTGLLSKDEATQEKIMEYATKMNESAVA
jgi:ABC-type sugar transport system, ATPase component